jgi:hypothetical protein
METNSLTFSHHRPPNSLWLPIGQTCHPNNLKNITSFVLFTLLNSSLLPLSKSLNEPILPYRWRLSRYTHIPSHLLSNQIQMKTVSLDSLQWLKVATVITQNLLISTQSHITIRWTILKCVKLFIMHVV